jgi:phosphoribosylformylglycinamidine cyclo-ligase
MKRDQVIDNAHIRDGDVIVGLSSTGRAKYEDFYNSGMGSNGLTSARHDVFAHYLAEKYPESFDPAVADELVYSGSYRLNDAIESLGMDAGRMVLSPTRTYAPVIREMLSQYRHVIHGMIHCSGGAQTKILNFVDNMHVVKDNMFEIPELFRIIQQESHTSWKEMYQVFNMGHRFEVYLPREHADGLIEISQSFGLEARKVGYCHGSTQKKLTIKSPKGTFEYT